MPTYDLYSKRKKRNRGDVPEVFQYENFPDPFRQQVMHILMDLFPVPEKKREEYFKRIHDILCREYGLKELNQVKGYKDRVQFFLLSCEDIEVLDKFSAHLNTMKILDKMNCMNW